MVSKNDLSNKLMLKWKKIKDHYTKSEKKKIKSGQAAISGRGYIYSQQLSLLQTTDATRDPQSSIDNNLLFDQEESVEQQELHNNTSQLDRSECSLLNEQNSTKKRKCDIESIIEFINTLIPTTLSNIPDRSFFESILPSISGFTEDQKIEFCCEVLNIIKRIRNPQTVQ
ncbi:Hypothetical protein CINCED_3A018508 [Cinara cedri]|nr:Hypothetical protein CINCED_3A018508 [Cinara cedri]